MSEVSYTYEQAIADAPKHVERRRDLPAEPGWYVCLDDFGDFYLRWFNSEWFSIYCGQTEAERKKLNGMAREKTGFEILGWCKPWWVKECGRSSDPGKRKELK